MTLFGKVAIVTGASRNIGKSVAVALARSGADIGFVYRANTQTADETAREIRTLGRRVVYAQVDVMDWKASHAFVERVAKELGRVDILVSNAGNPSSVRAPLAEQDPEEMDLQFRTHVMGALHFCKAAIPHMRRVKRGQIIFVSSVAARTLSPNRGHYGAAKAALEAFGKVLAKEEQPHGIRVNVVGPGAIDETYERGRGPGTLAKAMATAPFGRLPCMDDIANLVLFLVSDAGEYITGQVIYVDGGEAAPGAPRAKV